jgi:hypothetical protein
MATADGAATAICCRHGACTQTRYTLSLTRTGQAVDLGLVSTWQCSTRSPADATPDAADGLGAGATVNMLTEGVGSDAWQSRHGQSRTHAHAPRSARRSVAHTRHGQSRTRACATVSRPVCRAKRMSRRRATQTHSRAVSRSCATVSLAHLYTRTHTRAHARAHTHAHGYSRSQMSDMGLSVAGAGPPPMTDRMASWPSAGRSSHWVTLSRPLRETCGPLPGSVCVGGGACGLDVS